MSKIELLRSGDDIVQTLQVVDADNGTLNTWYSSKYSCTFTDYQSNASKVTKMSWNCNTAGTMTITGIRITSSVVSCTPGNEIPIGSLERKYYENNEWKTGTVTVSYGTGVGTPMGDGNATQDEYVDLSAYSELRLYISSGEPRLFLVKEEVFTSSDDGYILTKAGVKQNGQWNGVQDTDHKLQKRGDYYFITVSDIKAACGGQAKLIGVKAEYGQTVNISNIVVIDPSSTYDYIFSGSGSMTTAAKIALADATATSYDATGITKAVALATANRNALIVANEGMVTNTRNVIVAGVCANLVLTDGYAFKAPADFTATTASYTTSISDAATRCLPFAAAIPSGVTAWTLAYTSGDAATATEVVGTIPANTPVLLNGSGDATFDGSVVSIDADAANVSGALTGVFEATTVPTGSYVLQNGTSGLAFYKVASDITAAPFRAYLTAASSARSLKIDFGGTTAIESVATETQADAQAYDLQGRRISKPAKGLYIVNGKKYIAK